ncbi:MAG TPA: sigma-54-dependent Fis family transcriptional regulator [Proteobacteria bacterium]|nr:sigma-54-dependent Fis family transcriptional regulator [Pseudomonadota bacterium]
MARILIVDDEKGLRRSTAIAFQLRGHQVEEAGTGEEALEFVRKDIFDLVITDLVMEDMDGLELIKKIKALCPISSVIMMTAYGSIDSAIAATKLGVSDYVTKPFTEDQILLAAEKAFQRQKMESTIRVLQSVLIDKYQFKNIITVSRELKEILRKICLVATQNITVLLMGESGTGKELIAAALHRVSHRKDRPFVALNCGAFPETLLESELFGHTRGAFTGATSHKKGLVEEADGGTIFLDEIGDAPLSFQVKILRFLEDGEFRRLGKTITRKADVRIIAATHKNLEHEIEAGRFRDDLFFRLSACRFDLPPLRARKEDIPFLAQHFLKTYSSEMNKQVDMIHPRVYNIFLGYSWPGNVRELENTIRYALAITPKNCIDIEDLPGSLQKLVREKILPVYSSDQPASLSDLEKGYILSVLEKTGWNKKKACEILQISKATLHRRLKEYKQLFTAETTEAAEIKKD